MLLVKLINAFLFKKIHKPAGQRIFQTQGPGHTSISNSLTKHVGFSGIICGICAKFNFCEL